MYFKLSQILLPSILTLTCPLELCVVALVPARPCHHYTWDLSFEYKVPNGVCGIKVVTSFVAKYFQLDGELCRLMDLAGSKPRIST